MFDPRHLVDKVEFDLNCHDIIDYCHKIRHPFDVGEYEASELRQEDHREQKRMMFQNVLPLRT